MHGFESGRPLWGVFSIFALAFSQTTDAARVFPSAHPELIVRYNTRIRAHVIMHAQQFPQEDAGEP